MDINDWTKDELVIMVSDLSKENAYLRCFSNKSKSLINFGDYILDWLKNGKYKWQDTTYEGYLNIVKNHIAPYFRQNKITLQEIKPSHIETYYYFKIKEGLSGNTIRHHHANIRSCLRSALKDELITNNPAILADLPPNIKTEIDYYCKEDLLKLLQLSRETMIYPIVLLTSFGLRRSEALGLRWSDVDVENSVLKIRQKVVYVNGEGIKIDSILKTKSSYRFLKVPDFVLNELEYVHQRQYKESEKCIHGYSEEYTDYICVNREGRLIMPHYASDVFLNKIIRQNKLKSVTLKGLRHTCATLISEMGFNLKYIQEWLGHSTIMLTANTYTHVNMEEKLKVANAFQENIYKK